LFTLSEDRKEKEKKVKNYIWFDLRKKSLNLNRSFYKRKKLHDNIIPNISLDLFIKNAYKLYLKSK